MAAQESTSLMPLVTIGVAAITGLFTILGVALANRSSHKQLVARLEHADDAAQKEALRARLEELYQLGDQWAGSVVTHHAGFRRVMEGMLSYNEVLDLEVERKPNFNAARMFTLAELYFPDAHAELDEIKSLRDLAATILAEFTELHRHSGATSKKHADGITDALSHFDVAVDEYKKKLAEYARRV